MVVTRSGEVSCSEVYERPRRRGPTEGDSGGGVRRSRIKGSGLDDVKGLQSENYREVTSVRYGWYRFEDGWPVLDDVTGGDSEVSTS